MPEGLAQSREPGVVTKPGRWTASLFAVVARWTAIAMACYHIWTSIFGIPSAVQHRAIHLAFGMALAFLTKSGSKGKGSRTYALDALLLLIGVGSMIYAATQYVAMAYRVGSPTQWDIVFGIATILIILELARRVVGFQLMLVPVAFLLYLMLGQYIPGPLGHKPYSIARVINTLFLGTEGIFGAPLGASAVYVVVFVILGAVFEKTGLGEFFIKSAYSLTGRSASGPAQTAVVASGLFGMISGSPSANVVTSGAFTIPLMKSVGYRPEMAGAIEAVASTGGQIMPPIMGATAFIIAETLGIPYLKLIGHAFIPAVLYFVAAGVSVHLQAKKRGLRANLKDVPRFIDVARSGWIYALPLLILLYLLIVVRLSPYKAAMVCLFATVLAAAVRPSTRVTFAGLLDAFEASSRSTLTIVSACAASGIVIGVVTLTGLGLKLSMAVMDIAGGSLLVALLLTHATAIVLGMAVPTTAAYLTTSVLLCPVLTQMGVPPIVAHLFVFYAAIVSNLTPPVCVASYAAAGVAKADPWRTAVNGFLLGIPGPYLIPYIFVYRPVLLLVNNPGVREVIGAILIGLAAVLALAVALRGYALTHLTMPERVVAITACVLLIPPVHLATLLGLVLFGALLVVQVVRLKRTPRLGEAAAAGR